MELPVLLVAIRHSSILEQVSLALLISESKRIQSTLEKIIFGYIKIESNLQSLNRAKNFVEMEPEPGYGDQIQEGLKHFKYGSKKSLEAFKKWDYEESSKVELGRGEIILEKVSARYATASKNTLNDISIRISPGEKVGIVGRTGSGKSSIVKLLWQYMLPTEGTIFLDGTNYT